VRPQTVRKDNDGHDWVTEDEIFGIPQEKIHDENDYGY